MSCSNPTGTGPGPGAGTDWRSALAEPRARRWYIGAGVAALLWGTGAWTARMVDDTPVLLKLAIGANMVAMFVAYTALPPLSWGRTVRFKLAAFGVLLAVDLLLFLTLGPESSWTWTFVAVAAAMQAYPGPIGYYLIAGLGVSALLLQLAAGEALEQSLVQPAIILSGGLMMHAFGRQTETVRQLRNAQNELAALAVAEERNRVARDMHDILGHSLTVIAVKAELAGRLIAIAPEKAAAEVAQLEDLARGALADVRATVSGYRGVNISSELASARSALEAAGIEPQLPGAADEVPAKFRELFGWVLREAVTNVVRHSGASRCTVTLGSSAIQIDDDGRGPAGNSGGGGLRGLRERTAAHGATLSLGPSPMGGFRVRVSA
ncbi:sensor histidine kinase [Arthrobacter sp. NPDC058192]|uniref:sensor histidine kinase n=1 Tax=Arthrobacter sp. NPDC058192 TaxID=3346372 RepID=UPI0036EA6F38